MKYSNGSSNRILSVVRRSVYGTLIADVALVLRELVGLAVPSSGRPDPRACEWGRFAYSGSFGKLLGVFGYCLRSRVNLF
jgi:hypothetical protein